MLFAGCCGCNCLVGVAGNGANLRVLAGVSVLGGALLVCGAVFVYSCGFAFLSPFVVRDASFVVVHQKRELKSMGVTFVPPYVTGTLPVDASCA